MAYTNTVPQANDQISATQAPILANFQFLQTGLNVEHNFNPSGTGTDLYHKKASMPNLVGPETKPAATDGMYYVKGGIPKFVNAAVSFLPYSNCQEYALSGSIVLTTTLQTVLSVPIESCGDFYIFSKTQVAYSLSKFVSTNTGFTIVAIGSTVVNLAVSSPFNIQAKVSSGSGTFFWVLKVFSP